MERGAVAAVYCSRRAHPIAPRISIVNNLHYGAARALTLTLENDFLSRALGKAGLLSAKR
ncbi:hypothetical protein C6Q13_16870 [Burkholderia gladioli]|nr:hypothetical protein C6Q13_16870 [Burkholderia gladioli]